MIENKKIRGATTKEYDGIKFKSLLEVTIYKTLKQEGFDVKYEPTKYHMWEGFKPTVPFYNKDKNTRELRLDDKKLIDITYTPDFVFEYNDMTIIIEAKGFENDCFYLKKKLFRGYLEQLKNQGKFFMYFEIYTKKQLLQAIKIIRNEYSLENRESNK